MTAGCIRSACAVALGWSLALAAPAISEAPRARGGVRLVEAMERAPTVVVAQVEASRTLGTSAHAATLLVEATVAGAGEAGDRIPIAWEELAPSRAPRFAAGDRVLVALEPLPGASIWLTRIPAAEQREATQTVAMRGDAYLYDPAPGSVLLLEHYLALTPEERAGPAGTDRLARLAAGGGLSLATNAVERLSARAKLAEMVSPTVAEYLVAALLREDSTPRFHEVLLELIARHRPDAIRVVLETMTAGDSLAPAIIYAALAETTGGLSARKSARLREQAPARYRRIGARTASGKGAEDELRQLMRNDPDAGVRIHAIERLAELGGTAVIPTLADALRDPLPNVRAAAAKELGGFGAEAVSDLRRVTEGSDIEAARVAVAGLMWANCAEGDAALGVIAVEHADESVRTLAALALGKAVGEVHRED